MLIIKAERLGKHANYGNSEEVSKNALQKQAASPALSIKSCNYSWLLVFSRSQRAKAGKKSLPRPNPY